MKNRSLGLMETWGWVPAIVAADAASKAAVVSLLGYELARTGLVTVKVAGEVAAVQAAVAAGAAAAEEVGRVVTVHVIPRPDSQLWRPQHGPGGPQRPDETSMPGGSSPGESAAGESSGSADEQEAARPPVQAEASQGADGAARVKRVRAKAAKPERGGKAKPGGRGKRE